MLDILYQQGPVWGLNKPPGLATQAPEGIDSLEAQLRAHLKQLEQKTGNIYLGVPHRLDRAASGAIVFARHVRAARRISPRGLCSAASGRIGQALDSPVGITNVATSCGQG